jgi:hypothetical protein
MSATPDVRAAAYDAEYWQRRYELNGERFEWYCSIEAVLSEVSTRGGVPLLLSLYVALTHAPGVECCAGRRSL